MNFAGWVISMRRSLTSGPFPIRETERLILNTRSKSALLTRSNFRVVLAEDASLVRWGLPSIIFRSRNYSLEIGEAYCPAATGSGFQLPCKPMDGIIRISALLFPSQIGRASCRESVCPYV